MRQKKIKIQAASQADDRVRGFLAGDHQGAVPALSAWFFLLTGELFYRDNTLMLFADAKKMTEEIVKHLDE